MESLLTPTLADTNLPSRPTHSLTGLTFAFALGVVAFPLLIKPLPWTWLLASVLSLGLGAISLGRCPAGRAMGLASAVLIGVAWSQFHACLTLCRPFPEAQVGADLTIEGQIASMPTDRDLSRRFLFRCESARRGDADIGFSGLVRLSWYHDAPPLSVGERWRLRVRLKPPHGYANPGGFDYERWLFDQGVTATGTVRDGVGNTRLAAGPGGYWLDRVRERLRDHIAAYLNVSPAKGVVQALTLGERGAIPRSQWDILTRTGTNHLVAISGLHVGLIAGLGFVIVRRLWALSPRLALAFPAPRAAALAAVAAALAYSALAGFSVPTQRALAMLTVVLAALFWGRTLRPFAAMMLALGAVLILDPQAVLSYGFWLSFGAVGLLIYVLGARPLALAGPLSGHAQAKGYAGDKPDDAGPSLRGVSARAWRRWATPQWAVGLGLLPSLLLFFGRASVIAPAVNLVLIPFFALLLPVLFAVVALSWIPGLGQPLVWMGQLISWGLDGLGTLASLSWAAVTVAVRPTWVWVAAFVGVALWLAPRGLPGRSLGFVALLPLVLVRAPMPTEGDVWVTLLDVGQGLSVVVRTRGHTLVYDVGPAFPSGFDTGSAVVVPFLQQAGVSGVDTLILSHADKDHAGGLVGLRQGIPIARLLSGEPGAIRDGEVQPCRAGDGWVWDGVTFEVLHPGPDVAAGNDSSCVLRVGVGKASILLTGDIGRRVELGLVKALGDRLASEVLVAAHHGSAGSSSRTFLDAVRPRYVLYATGFADRFGFPAASVRRRVAALGAMELDTAECGAISLRLVPGRGLVDLTCERAAHLRLWTHHPSLGR